MIRKLGCNFLRACPHNCLHEFWLAVLILSEYIFSFFYLFLINNPFGDKYFACKVSVRSSVGQLSCQPIILSANYSVCELSVGQLSVDELSVGKLSAHAQEVPVMKGALLSLYL